MRLLTPYIENFNPRGNISLDKKGSLIIAEAKVFQSTRSQRPRQHRARIATANNIFQSTRSQRPRHSAVFPKAVQDIFQSTRSQRPRQYILLKSLFINNFNPRGRKDLDLDYPFSRPYPHHFNPRGRKDLDDKVIIGPEDYSIFQSTRSQRPRPGP